MSLLHQMPCPTKQAQTWPVDTKNCHQKHPTRLNRHSSENQVNNSSLRSFTAVADGQEFHGRPGCDVTRDPRHSQAPKLKVRLEVSSRLFLLCWLCVHCHEAV